MNLLSSSIAYLRIFGFGKTDFRSVNDRYGEAVLALATTRVSFRNWKVAAATIVATLLLVGVGLVASPSDSDRTETPTQAQGATAHYEQIDTHDHGAHVHGDDPSSDALPLGEELAFTAQRDRTLVRLYVAYFGRDPDVSGLDYWRGRMWEGVSAHAISSAFASSQEFQQRYGHLSNEQFVDLVYRNVLERSPDLAGKQYWTGMLGKGLSRGELMLGFSESGEFVQKTSDRETPSGLRRFSNEDRRGQAVLDRIAYPWKQQLPEWTIDFVPGKAGYYGLTFVGQQKIVIYVRSSQSDTHLAHVVAHEIGHAVDVSRNSGNDRRRWQKARGIEGSDWWPTRSGATDSATGAGDFAESFADWQVSSGIFRSQLAGRPTASQRALLTELSYQ